MATGSKRDLVLETLLLADDTVTLTRVPFSSVDRVTDVPFESVYFARSFDRLARYVDVPYDRSTAQKNIIRTRALADPDLLLLVVAPPILLHRVWQPDCIPAALSSLLLRESEVSKSFGVSVCS